MDRKFRRNKRHFKTKKWNVGSSKRFECEPCLFDGTCEKAVGFCKICAEYLCDRCIKEHKKVKMTRQHPIVTDKLPEQPDVVKEMREMIRCSNHPEMTITAKCITHGVYLCPVCVTETHRRCEITDVSEWKKDGNEAKNVHRSLDELMNMTCSVKCNVQNNKKSISEDGDRVRKEISAYVQEITETAKKYESKAQEEVENVTEKALCEMEKVNNESEEIEKEILHNRCLLEAAVQFGNDNDDICLADVLTDKIASLRERTKTLHEKPRLKLEFKGSTNMQCLGNVEVTEHGEPIKSPNRSMIEMSSDIIEEEQVSTTTEDSSEDEYTYQNIKQPSSVSTDEAVYGVRECNDKEPCVIYKLLLLNDERLILLDVDNSKLKVLNPDFSVNLSLKVNKNPLDMCQIAANIIAVAFHHKKRIEKYKVEEDKILHIGRITTELFCLGIAVYRENVIAVLMSEREYRAEGRTSDRDSTEIQIRNSRNGRIYKTYSTFISVSAKEHSLLLRNPRRIVFTGKNNLVLLEEKRVIGLTLIPSESKAKEKWFYACSSDGLYGDMRDVTYDGKMLYICADKGGVLEMSPANSRTPTAIIDVASARSFAIDRKRKRMIVGCTSDDNLHVYDFK